MAEVEVRGLRFHVQTAGRGERAVVLIHGWGLDNSSSQYFLLAPGLTAGRKVVCYDLRGHGMTEQPKTGYSLAEHALDLGGILDALGLVGAPVGLVGTSMGGRIALAFASMFPERVESIVLLDSELVDDPEQVERFAELMAKGPKAFENPVRDFWEEFLDEHRQPDGTLDRDATLLADWMESKRDVRRKLRIGRTFYGLIWRTSFFEDVRNEPPWDWELLAATVRCPVLALYGDRSNALETGRLLEQTLPSCTLELVPDTGHFVIYRTDLVREALKRWFLAADELTAGSAAG